MQQKKKSNFLREKLTSETVIITDQQEQDKAMRISTQEYLQLNLLKLIL